MNAVYQIQSTLHMPESATTRDGLVWNPNDNHWILPSACRKLYFSFHKIADHVTNDLLLSIKLLIIHYLKTQSMEYANTITNNLIAFLLFIDEPTGLSEIKPEHILAYRASLSTRSEYRLGSLRTFFQTWLNLGMPGINPAAVNLLNDLKLKAPASGEAILTADPNMGPFSDIEFQAITTGLNQSFSIGTTTPEDYLLIWLFLALGSRPVQLAMLKVKDFQVVETSHGAKTYLLHIPRAKQKGEPPRTQFKIRKIISRIGLIIEKHIEFIKAKHADLFLSLGDLPFFVNPKNIDAVLELQYHSTADDLGVRMDRVFETLSIQSERTGQPIVINARRFRYTRGTRAAAEGLNEFVIADILDHSDTHNVGVYVKSVPEIIERIDMAMALHLAPMAQAFMGTMIDTEGQAIRANDPRSRIVTPIDIGRPLGNCGSFGFCGAMAPLACYTCRSFQPWKDGPHLKILQSLINERERIYSETEDMSIASINDRTILACAEVVRRCSDDQSQEAGA